MIGILVADCFPVLLFDPEKQVAAPCMSAGGAPPPALSARRCRRCWIISAAGRPGLQAAVGPGIGAHSYEVDRPVRDAFRQGAGDWEEITKEVALGKWLLDLRHSCLLQLAAAGLDPAQVSAAEEDTCCHRELFFSYRRDNGKTGRQMGFILLR